MTKYGYARVSTPEQMVSLETQREALHAKGVQPQHVYADVCSGAKKSRPEFDALVRAVDDGDEILCSKVDRLGRTLVETLETILDLTKRGVTVTTEDLGVLDPKSAAGEAHLSMMLVFAQFERRRNIERTHEGMAKARKSGKKIGRPSKVTDSIRDAVLACHNSGMNISQIAKLHHVSRNTVYKIIEASTLADVD